MGLLRWMVVSAITCLHKDLLDRGLNPPNSELSSFD